MTYYCYWSSNLVIILLLVAYYYYRSSPACVPVKCAPASLLLHPQQSFPGKMFVLLTFVVNLNVILHMFFFFFNYVENIVFVHSILT